MKTRLRLDAEIDLLNKQELDATLGEHMSWEREAAFGLRHQDLPRMIGTPSAGNLALGGDQADQVFCGPKEGWYMGVQRISVDGLASGDALRIYKGAKFIGWITYQPGFLTFGKAQCVLKPGEFLRVVGAGLTTTAQVEVYGEALTAPGPMMWKLLS